MSQIKFIVADYLPLDICTSKAYREHIQSYNPHAHHFAQDTVIKKLGILSQRIIPRAIFAIAFGKFNANVVHVLVVNNGTIERV